MTHRDDSERGGSPVFEPDTLLGSQYFDRVRRRAGHEGERQLMVAILEDAVHTYLKHAGATDPAHQELFRDTETWIESRDQTWFYSFGNVCAVLELEAEYIRRGLHAWKERGHAGAAEEFRRASGA